MWWEKVVTSFLFIGPIGVGALWSIYYDMTI